MSSTITDPSVGGRQKSEFLATFSQVWKRIGPAVIGLVIIIAAGVTIFEGLTFLSILDRILLLSAAALLTLVVILALMFQLKVGEVGVANDRLSAATRERDEARKIADMVPALKRENAELAGKLSQSESALIAAAAHAAVLSEDVAQQTARADAAEAKIASLRAERDAARAQLERAGEELANVVKKVGELEGRFASLVSEKTGLEEIKARLDQQVASLQLEVSQRDRSIQQVQTDLDQERSSTSRAQYVPSFEVSYGTEGFGILAPKRMFVTVKNVGPGIARDVSLDVSDATAGGPVTPAAYWTAIPAGEFRRANLGTLDVLPSSVRCQVKFNSQFGPVQPAEVIFTPG